MTLTAGSRVGKYEIKQLLGAGGMGEVYLAHDTELKRPAALKILPADVAEDRGRMSRFTREARAASALNHPNILTIYDVGREGPLHFIAAEFIEGETLHQLSKGRRLSSDEVLDVAVQVADALAAAHEAGIVHRDIKPENVMVRRRDGYVKVLDFGLAKLGGPHPAAADSEAPTEALGLKTGPGVVMGTAPYMSPEQARAEPLDARTDVFSFGVMLYELASGRHPFKRASYAETVAAVLTHEPPFEEDLADAPEGLREVLRRCVEKERERRYADAGELLPDVRRLRRSQGVFKRDGRGFLPTAPAARGGAGADTAGQDAKTRALEPAARTDAGRGSRQKILLAGAAALLLLAAVVGGVWLTRGRRPAFGPLEVGRVTQVTLWPGLDDFPSISPDGNAVAYCSDHGGGFEIYVKALTAGSKEVQLTSGEGQNFQPAWSPDGRQIAFHSKSRGGVWLIPATGGEARQLTEFGTNPAWSPDGKLIAFQSGALTDLAANARSALAPSTLWLVPSAGGEPRQLTQVGLPLGGHGSPSFSPDGRRVAFEVDEFNNAVAWTVSVEGGDAKQVSPQRGYAPVYAPDGRSIFYNAAGVVYRIQVSETGEPFGEPAAMREFAGRTSFVRRLSFSADGRRVAYSLLNRSENISDVALRPNTFEPAGAPSVLISNSGTRNNHPVYSPDGRRVAFTSCAFSGTSCDIWLADAADGGNLTQLTTHEKNEQMAAWFPDSRQIGFVSDRLGHMTYWAIDLGTKRERMLFDFGEGLDYMRLSPDATRIAFNYKGREGVFNVWVAPLAGGEPRQLTFDRELMGFAAWSPDGRWLGLQRKIGDDTHIHVLPSEGGEPAQLTSDRGQSWAFGWAPDNDKVLFAGFRDNLWNVWWVSRTTRRQQRLTDYRKLNSFVRYPSWSPKGDRVVYQYSETTGNIWVADLK